MVTTLALQNALQITKPRQVLFSAHTYAFCYKITIYLLKVLEFKTYFAKCHVFISPYLSIPLDFHYLSQMEKEKLSQMKNQSSLITAILSIMVLVCSCGKDTKQILSFKKEVYESYVCSSHMITALVSAGQDYENGKHFFYPNDCSMVSIEDVNLTTVRMNPDAYSKMSIPELAAFTRKASQEMEGIDESHLKDCVYCSSQQEAMSCIAFAFDVYKIQTLNGQMLSDAQKVLPDGDDYKILEELYSYAEQLYKLATSSNIDSHTLYTQWQIVASKFEKAFDKSDDLFPKAIINKVEAQELAEKQISIIMNNNRDKALLK